MRLDTITDRTFLTPAFAASKAGVVCRYCIDSRLAFMLKISMPTN